MNRESRRLQDDCDLVNDTEVYSALWAAAKFPRLPEDAPDELKRLTIDLDDPKRVYAIHRASRRHYFHLLVERYIIQIRYGCQSINCTTTTCFSCRKRVAGGAPVRRYNSTSARTLAVYMASQDNPEQGLCHHPSTEQSVLQVTKHSRRYLASDPKNPPFSQGSGAKKQHEDITAPKTITARTGNTRIKSQENGEISEPSRNTTSPGRRRSGAIDSRILEDPTRTDHRSFIQNVFGTVAFRMLEWLTPRNLEAIAAMEDDQVAASDETVSKQSRNAGDLSKEDHNTSPESFTSNRNTEESVSEEQTRHREERRLSQPRNQSRPSRQGSARQDSEHAKDSKFNDKGFASHKRSHIRTSSDSLESQLPKGILNRPMRMAELSNDVASINGTLPPSQQKQRPPRQTLITSPKLRASETCSFSNGDPKPIQPKAAVEKVLKVTNLESKSDPGVIRTPEEQEQASGLGKERKTAKTRIYKLPRGSSPPQSLSYLPIEVINLLCDITETDGTCETHSLHPTIIGHHLKRRRNNLGTLVRASHPRSSDSPFSPVDLWRSFIEQSLFDVLRKPESLLRSFQNEGNRPYDTQTMWYLLLRMTRVAPSLVFDSLWNASGALFNPSEKLEAVYDWAKDFSSHKAVTNKAVSNFDAAQILNICLHALVAAVPLVSNARQISNMSRIRSYGHSTPTGEASSLESIDLCLQYEDAFTNDLAMRLARRIFSAISTRRKFAELLDLQVNTGDVEKREPDILETVLESLRFLDLGTPPLLNFSEDERGLHEKRAPTLILDWARTVMLQDWGGSAEASSDGAFGGALATVAAIYSSRKSLLLGDIHFRTKYFADCLDPIGMPLEWLAFQPNKKSVHLLDYPYLFEPSILVTYFRSINFSRMNTAFETAKATFGLVYHTIAENSLIVDKSRRDRLHDRLQISMSRFLVLDIRRSDILTDTFNSIWRREERELLRPIKVRLGEQEGEEGVDSGGVQQEFFRLAIAEALDPDYGIFTIDPRTRMTWFQPGSLEPLWKVELIGMIVSLAVYNGLTLPVTFPKALYRKLLDQDVSELHHIADGWPDLANGLTTLLEWDESNGQVEDIFARTYEFSVEQFGQNISREMGNSIHWPQFSDSQPSLSNPEDAPLVTNENRNSYVSDYIRWLTDISVRPQFEAFKTGFFSCIERRSVTLFDPSTLQSVIEGIQEIDIGEMRRASRYVGWEASHQSVRDFWSIIRKYDVDQKKKLLEFVTASDRVPVGGMRNIQFTLQRNGMDDGHLPTSYTCYGVLLLPEYSSKDILRSKLAMALENAKGFGFA